jgi:hypothetical protein
MNLWIVCPVLKFTELKIVSNRMEVSFNIIAECKRIICSHVDFWKFNKGNDALVLYLFCYSQINLKHLIDPSQNHSDYQ